MKRMLFKAFLLFLVLCPVMLSAAWEDSKEWLEIPAEYKKEITEKLKESKQFTEDQLETIGECLNESSAKEVLNCFSNGGVDGAAGVLVIIRDELGRIRDRICGSSIFGNRDQCEQFGDKLIRLKDDLQNTWNTTVERGKQYLQEKNKLLFMKRKICKKMDQEGCYQWLNDRIQLKCSPKRIGKDPAVIEKCQLDVADDVWKRLASDG